jgi:hypothetical protein
MGELVQSVSDVSIVELAVRIAVLVAIVFFVFFLQALWAPKPSAAGLSSRVQQSSGVQKKKGHRAKKAKKSRGVGPSKFMPASDEISDGELENGKAHAHDSSDVEAPTIPSPRVSDGELENGKAHAHDSSDDEAPTGSSPRVTFALGVAQNPLVGVSVENNESDSVREDVAVHTDVINVVSESSAASEEQQDDADICEDCAMPEVNIWGCPIQRTYTSSLLLMHRQMQVVVQRGPPGLEPPASLAAIQPPQWKLVPTCVL